MNCAQRVQTPAVANCGSCGRGLCSECANAYAPPTCPACVRVMAAHDKASETKQLVVSGALLLVGRKCTCLIGGPVIVDKRQISEIRNHAYERKPATPPEQSSCAPPRANV